MPTSQKHIGVVLMNTGTADLPDKEHIQMYLREFLMDPRIIKTPHVVWKPILENIILKARPDKTLERYQAFWTEKGSPFMLVSMEQRKALQAKLDEYSLEHPEYKFTVLLAMNYGNPSLNLAFKDLADARVDEAYFLPLFPQAAFVTTISCKDHAMRLAPTYPTVTKKKFLEDYSRHYRYSEILAQSIKDTWTYKSGSKLLFAFHSTPVEDIKAGDTYQTEIERSMAEVANLLQIPEDDWAIGYQSRYEDSRKWLTPNPKDFLIKWAKEGITDVAVVAPGFATDCLETFWDCEKEQYELYMNECEKAGIEGTFTYIPSLNAREDHIDFLAQLIKDCL